VSASPSLAELEVLGDRVYCDDELGLEWTEIEAVPEGPVLLRINARNETVLRALAMLEEHDASQSDAAERAELHRLEGKLDLALELLAEFVRGRTDALAPRRVRFNAGGLCWDWEEAPPRASVAAPNRADRPSPRASAPFAASERTPSPSPPAEASLASPRAGALLAVDCYVLPPWPLPIKLHCRVTAVDPLGAHEYRACARLEGQTDGVNEWLGKLVFRRHRRSIALQRQRG
jgi:hypothetical protein